MTRIRILFRQSMAALASLRLTVVCLIWLMILTFWGTVAQVQHGLYWAQTRFFMSWVFFAADVLPLPGGRLTLWVLFVNLSAAFVKRIRLHKNTVGLWLIHIGLLSYFVSAFVLFHTMNEYRLTMWEGETKGTVEKEWEWEVAAWPWRPHGAVWVTAYDPSRPEHPSDDVLKWPNGLVTRVRAWFPHASAMAMPAMSGAGLMVFNDSGIHFFEDKPVNKDPTQNTPAVVMDIVEPIELKGRKILLFGAETIPTIVPTARGPVAFQLRKRTAPLPFRLTLKDVTQTLHPHTRIARSYRSELILTHDDVRRPVVIEMNRPLRFKDWTVYQAGYGRDAVSQREFSTFSVVKNRFAYWPYVSFIITSLGLAIHFLSVSFKRRMAA